jgi:8-oxo-dGTP pyrophosphatase MutT (NUDIX family)
VVDQSDVRRMVLSLPETVEAEDHFGFSVPGKGGKRKGLLWTWNERVVPERPRVPNPQVIAVRVANQQEKDALIAADPAKFFTEPHYNGFPAVLVRLEVIDADELAELITDAWRCLASPSLIKSLRNPILSRLGHYRPDGDAEVADVEQVRALAQTAADPWLRSIPLHVTASAMIVHPASGRMLLRWHQHHQAWLQVGGHGDPGESDPLAIALREAGEETGLTDLVPWPDAQIRHVVIVRVPASGLEPAHEHADVRFVFATQTPDVARPETPDAPLRWLSPREAQEATSEPNLRETLLRVERLLTG